MFQLYLSSVSGVLLTGYIILYGFCDNSYGNVKFPFHFLSFVPVRALRSQYPDQAGSRLIRFSNNNDQTKTIIPADLLPYDQISFLSLTIYLLFLVSYSIPS